MLRHIRWLMVLLAIPVLLASGISMAEEAGTPLTRAEVRDFIETRIASARLQNRMRAGAGQHDDVVKAFFERRNELLQSRGWSVEEYEAVRERVHAARSAMREAAELAERRQSDAEIIREMKASGHVSEQQLAEMRSALEATTAEQRAWIDATRPDWPAVEYWLDELDAMTAWIAGNREQPPAL